MTKDVTGYDDPKTGKEEEARIVVNRRKMALVGRLWIAGAAFAILASSTQAYADVEPREPESVGSDGAVSPVEGDLQCERWGIDMIELKENDPAPEFFLKGPNRQEIRGTIFDERILEWEATVPVNFVVVVGEEPDLFSRAAAAHLYTFADSPATSDRDETAPDSSVIKQVRFCYGLPVELEALPRCADVVDGPQCPLDDKGFERNGSLTFADFDEPFFGGVPQCTCGELVLRDCNENAAAGEPDSCAGGIFQELTISVEFIKNVTDSASTQCRTRGGKRRCRTTD